MSLHAVILAGGRGERFWPLSRNHAPKQLLRLLGEETLLGGTLRRVSAQVPPERTWVITSSDLRPAIEALRLPVRPDRWLWEPVARNTAAAIGAASEVILAGSPEAEILALPSDHWIPDVASFWDTVETGQGVLREGYPIVTFGIRPAYPETGYGYVERGEPVPHLRGAFAAVRFHEKPDRERANQYLDRGTCYWNSGIFLFRAAEMATLLRRHVPECAGPLDDLRAALANSVAGEPRPPSAEELRRYFERAPSISIDHGVMERAGRVGLVEARFPWNDLGNWTSVVDQLPVDRDGNRTRGETLSLDSKGCILISAEGGLLAVLGVEDLIVVRIGDATLVCPRERAQEVRRLVQEGKADERLRRYF